MVTCVQGDTEQKQLFLLAEEQLRHLLILSEELCYVEMDVCVLCKGKTLVVTWCTGTQLTGMHLKHRLPFPWGLFRGEPL